VLKALTSLLAPQTQLPQASVLFNSVYSFAFTLLMLPCAGRLLPTLDSMQDIKIHS